jgi:hypothetical protein
MDSGGLLLYCKGVLQGKGDKGSKKTRKKEIVKPDPSPRNLPDWVFVVQFRAPAEPESARFAGRAEHVMSGQNTAFQTPEELFDFFGRVMRKLKLREQRAGSRPSGAVIATGR